MKTATRSDSISMATSFDGDAMGIEYVNGYSICASWNGGASIEGTIKLQASNNPFTDNVNMTPAPDAIWVDITGSSVSVSGAGTQFWNVADANYAAYRIIWTRVFGSATLTAKHLIKGPQ